MMEVNALNIIVFPPIPRASVMMASRQSLDFAKANARRNATFARVQPAPVAARYLEFLRGNLLYYQTPAAPPDGLHVPSFRPRGIERSVDPGETAFCSKPAQGFGKHHWLLHFENALHRGSEGK